MVRAQVCLAPARPLTSRSARMGDKFERHEYSDESVGRALKAVVALLHGLIDYAGLFPPSSEDMRPALENYASYLRSPDRCSLGRFIVPLSRLKELEAAGTDLLPRASDSEPWRLSVLVAEDVQSAAEEMLKFNRRHSVGSAGGHAVIDVAELKATTAEEIQHQRAALPPFFTAYFEIPHKGDVAALLEAIARTGSRAKIRTGGVTPDAFPTPTEIIDFIVACRREGVAFKATAGLHHPLRGEYRLTYEPDSPKGTMYGFLNVFLAAALIHAGESDDVALAALEEGDPNTFSFADDAVIWRGKRLDRRAIESSRSEFAISFGSCSFREPVDELDSLTRATHEIP
jgi:hypothetical protein